MKIVLIQKLKKTLSDDIIIDQHDLQIRNA